MRLSHHSGDAAGCCRVECCCSRSESDWQVRVTQSTDCKCNYEPVILTLSTYIDSHL